MDDFLARAFLCMFWSRVQKMNSLLEQTPTFSQIRGWFGFEDQLNLLGQFVDPIVLIASGNRLGFPSTTGCSNNKAFPPPGDFISRSAHSAMSKSVSTGIDTRIRSPALSSAVTNWAKPL